MGHDGPLSPQAQIRGVYMNTGSVDIGPDPGTLVSWLCFASINVWSPRSDYDIATGTWHGKLGRKNLVNAETGVYDGKD